MGRGALILGIAAAALGASACPAGASLLLGSTAQPAGSSRDSCSQSLVVYELADDASTPFIVPAPGGFITGWEINGFGAPVEGQETLVVLRPNGYSPGADGYTVLGTDTETFPFTFPANDLLTFTLATPIQVQAGDQFGLMTEGSGGACLFDGGQTPPSDIVGLLNTSGNPPTGQVLRVDNPGSAQNWTMNLAVMLAQQQDVSVSAAAGPAGASVGSFAELTASVANHGPASEPIAFTDSVPDGLAVQSAVAGVGSCTIAGQRVSCMLSGLAPGAQAPVVITVLPRAAGHYTNDVSVASTAGEPDPTPGNDTAGATLSVAMSGGSSRRGCVVPSLKDTPLSVAKHVLTLLGCKAREQTKRSSSQVAKGAVIGTRPGPGSYAKGKVVALTVSSGASHAAPRRRR
jgi:hypothetical protein